MKVTLFKYIEGRTRVKSLTIFVAYLKAATNWIFFTSREFLIVYCFESDNFGAFSIQPLKNLEWIFPFNLNLDLN